MGELSGMDTRPTTDRVKEGLFNIIQFDIEGRKVLDLFGGTGQLGIECLSRGAVHCTFVDQRKDAVKLIRENLEITGLTDRAKVVQGDALSFLSGTSERLHFSGKWYNYLRKSSEPRFAGTARPVSKRQRL
jgi:16S rRNA (guanine(966)-N(2))-methyltransferase RsmD